MGLLSDFTGKSARRDMQGAKAAGDAALQQGYDRGYGDYTAAGQMYEPYAQSGQQANQFYSDALGLNGDAARNTAVNTMTSSPLFQGELGQSSNAMARMLNAQGASGGGKAQLAGARVFQQTAGNWLDRYNGLGQQGQQATNAMATNRMARGDLSMNFGATKAGNEINFGNAMAANRSTGVNNLLGLAGTVIGGVNAFRQPTKIGN